MRSRPSSGRRRGSGPPDPEFLIDRSLSQLSLPQALRDAGLTVRTLAQVYGVQTAQETEDRTWLAPSWGTQLDSAMQGRSHSPAARGTRRTHRGEGPAVGARNWLARSEERRV